MTADTVAVSDAWVVGRPPELDLVLRAKSGDADAYASTSSSSTRDGRGDDLDLGREL